MILGAILVQNVSWKNTAAVIQTLEEKGLISIEKILLIPNDELAELIRPTRYFTNKTKSLKAFASCVLDEYDGDIQLLLELPLHELRKELLKIYGIGEETADSIILYGSQQPIFVVDAYTRRIFWRLGFFEEKISYQAMQKFFMSHIPKDVELYNEYHALIDCLGNRLCLNKKPRCMECPLQEICLV
jgi:endonuclease-3 related protein